jgi:hypothetical protein
MKIALIFGVVAVAANVLLVMYVKKKYQKSKADGLSGLENDPNVFSAGYLNTPELKRLRQSAAAELGISVEELDSMSIERITQLANEKKVTNSG